jgi:hypothetical protein
VVWLEQNGGCGYINSLLSFPEESPEISKAFAPTIRVGGGSGVGGNPYSPRGNNELLTIFARAEHRFDVNGPITLQEFGSLFRGFRPVEQFVSTVL